jgi:DeoR/GlpR family transcriptional regulator of sugar metabolism
MDQPTRSETACALGILRTLVGIGPCHVVKLAALLNEHPIPIDRTCDRLQQEGQLQRQHGGVYAITATGRSLLETTTQASETDAPTDGKTTVALDTNK